jgi:hypothetical protein
LRLKKDIRLVREYKICDWCLRRLIKEPSDKALTEAESFRSSCSLCHSIPFRGELVDEALGACSPYSFRTYNVSVRMDAHSLKIEDEIIAKYKLNDYVTLKKGLRNHLKMALAKVLNQRLQEVRPELNIVFDFTDKFRVKIYERAYHIRLNYIKLLPDAKVNAGLCPICNGKGCNECKYTGKANDGSLESFFIYVLPSMLNSTIPRLTWALKDIEGSTVSGNGSPVYLHFRSIYDRVRAPLMVPENPVHGIKFVLSQSLESTESMVRDFSMTIKMVLKLNVPLFEWEIRKRIGKGMLTLTGVEGKIWKKNVKILKVSIFNSLAELYIEMDSGINIYSWIGLRKGSSSKSVEPALFLEDEVSLVKIDVLDIRDRCVKDEQENLSNPAK